MYSPLAVLPMFVAFINIIAMMRADLMAYKLYHAFFAMLFMVISYIFHRR